MTGFIDDSVVDKIKDRVDIVDLISDYVKLDKSGSNHLGLCPFHSEKTPSFSVSEPKQFFHCFGCGVGGDLFEFIMKKENLSFPDAIRFIGDKYNIEVVEASQEDRVLEDKKERFYSINRDTAMYFLNNLEKDAKSRNYLENRGISNKLSRKFGLGYAKDSWEDLHNYLQSKGYQSEELEDLGLVSKRKNSSGYYDKFRNRIIFPIIDNRSRVIGFGGRVMDDSKPKYLNSPETLVFHKGYSLYGINMVDRYSNRDSIVLVEGYMDVISLFNNGINFSVASLGTAFTEHQARLLKRYGRDIYICYDSDQAGVKATEAVISILLREGIKPRIIMLGSYKDPDDFFKDNKKEDFLNKMKEALNFIDYKIAINKRNYNLEELEGKINFTKTIAGEIGLLENPIERDVYINKLSEELNISKDAIKKEINNRNLAARPSYEEGYKRQEPEARPVKRLVAKADLLAEIELIKIMIQDKKYYELIYDEDIFKDFQNETCIDVVGIIKNIYKTEDYLEKQRLYDIMQGRSKINSQVLKMIIDEDKILYGPDEIELVVEDLIKTLKINKIIQRRKVVRDRIEFIDKGEIDIEEANKLLKELLELNAQLDNMR